MLPFMDSHPTVLTSQLHRTCCGGLTKWSAPVNGTWITAGANVLVSIVQSRLSRSLSLASRDVTLLHLTQTLLPLKEEERAGEQEREAIADGGAKLG